MKFIYVTSEEDKKRLEELGYRYIKKQKASKGNDKTLYVFENKEDKTALFTIDNEDISCIYSDIMMF